MRKLIFILLFAASAAGAQNLTHPKYVTAILDSLTATVRDTTFPAQPAKRWDSFTFYFTTDALFKIGAPDTTDWGSRPWLPISSYTVISVGSATPLTRIAYKAVGTAGQTVMLGTSGRR